ncbi:MAG TPA: hypothetical protein VLM38_08080 [Blastocatellia bacterium]|nr:hypothetical protein [Blastocatellia bacterium]
MTSKSDGEMMMTCRETRKRFATLDGRGTNVSSQERAAAERHVDTCSRCATEYRLFALQRAALDAAAAPEPIAPDEDFFKALRARIARGPDPVPSRTSDESWTGALLLTARQLIPAMAVLLLLMAGATLFWNQRPTGVDQAALRPRDRVVFSDIYDYPPPTADDVLETLVAIEEK